MGTHPIFESDFDCLTVMLQWSVTYTTNQTRKSPKYSDGHLHIVKQRGYLFDHMGKQQACIYHNDMAQVGQDTIIDGGRLKIIVNEQITTKRKIYNDHNVIDVELELPEIEIVTRPSTVIITEITSDDENDEIRPKRIKHF